MLHIQLYVENDQGVLEEVELYKDESVTLTQSIQDVTDIEKLFTDYSRTFNVPASKLNNKFFKHFYNYNIDGFDARRKKTAELHLNYKPFKKGKIKLEGVQLKNNEPHTYKLTFFGNTITIKDLFGDDKLSVLSELSVFNIVYNNANVQAYMTNGFDQNIFDKQINDAIIFPLISHTHRWVYSSDSGLSYNLNPDVSSDAYGLYFNQLKPAIRLYAVIKAIETHYRLEFSEDFFNQTNEDFYNLYMWLHKKEGSLFQDQDAEYSITGFGNITGDTDKITGVRNASFVNDFDEDKNVRTMHFRVDPSNNDPYGLIIKRDGKEFQKYDNLTGLSITGTPNEDGIIEPLEIEPGEYTFFIVSDNTATYDIEATIYNDPSSIFRSSKSITFTTSTSVLSEQTINIPSQLPDIKVVDFLSGIFKMFNLTAFLNDNDVLVIQPLDEFYASSTKSWDITKYLDKESTSVDSIIPFKQVNLQYDKTETFLAKNHKNLANKEWGQLLYREADKFEGDTYEIKLPFEHLKYERLSDASTGSLTSVMWGWAADAKQESTATEPILFYPVTNAATEIAAVDFNGTRVDISEPYMPSNSNGIGTTENQSLNFHPEFDEWKLQPNPKTLFKTFYENYIKDLFDKRKRLTKVSAFLPVGMMENLSLADQIIIFDRVYKINKITTNFETNKSELELINELQPRVYFQPKATSTLPISNNIITADSTYITVDQGDETNDGFDIPPETQEIPADVDTNVVSNDEIAPCVVTPATIYQVYGTTGCDQITFTGVINSAGTICDFANIDEYGFLLATNSSYLTASDNIDTLKADSNIEVRAIYRQETSLSIGAKTTIKTGLTDPATYYARFYVRTNTLDKYDKADVISNVVTEVTECANAKEREFYSSLTFVGQSFSSIPLYEDILDLSPTDQPNESGIFEVWNHNGLSDQPALGDNVKLNPSTYSNYNNYNGGTDSFPSTYVQGSNNYFVISFTDDVKPLDSSSARHTINGYMVIEFSTGQIVAVYDVPVSLCDSSYYTSGGKIGNVVGRALPGDIAIIYQTSNLNKTVLGKYQIATFTGMVYSKTKSLLESNRAGIIQDFIDFKILPNGVEIVFIESSNATTNNSLTYWNEDDTLKNSQHLVKKENVAGTYYASPFIGYCNEVHTVGPIVTTNALLDFKNGVGQTLKQYVETTYYGSLLHNITFSKYNVSDLIGQTGQLIYEPSNRWSVSTIQRIVEWFTSQENPTEGTWYDVSHTWKVLDRYGNDDGVFEVGDVSSSQIKYQKNYFNMYQIYIIGSASITGSGASGGSSNILTTNTGDIEST